MNNAVMANEARAVGREIAEPTTAPATLESSQVDWENRFTPNALPTDQLPLKKLARFTPKLSSVTVAPNMNARRLRHVPQNCESEAP